MTWAFRELSRSEMVEETALEESKSVEDAELVGLHHIFGELLQVMIA